MYDKIAMTYKSNMLILGFKGHIFKQIKEYSGLEKIKYNFSENVIELWGDPQCIRTAKDIILRTIF